VQPLRQHYTWRELVALYRLTQPAINLRPRYNIFPMTMIDAVVERDDAQSAAHKTRQRLPGFWVLSANYSDTGNAKRLGDVRTCVEAACLSST
jgi:putative SOS response-associated peptidase YedK